MARHLRDMPAAAPAFTPEIRREQLFASPVAGQCELAFSTTVLARLHQASWTDCAGETCEMSCYWLEDLVNYLEWEFAKSGYASAPTLTVVPPHDGS